MVPFRVHFSDVNWTSIIINDYYPIATLITIVIVLNDLIDHHLRLHIVIKAALLTLMVFIDLEARELSGTHAANFNRIVEVTLVASFHYFDLAVVNVRVALLLLR